MSRPIAVAITGGIGAGKSEALKAFARHGAATVSSDEIVHHLLRRPDVRDAVVARMGNGIVTPDGEIDRGALATVVFNDREALAWLEGLLHPLVAVEYLQWRDQLAALPSAPRVSVTEVRLLDESGGDARFDKVVVITAPKKLRRARSDVAVDDRERRFIDDREKVGARRLLLQEHGLDRRAGRIRRVGDARPHFDVRKPLRARPDRRRCRRGVPLVNGRCRRGTSASAIRCTIPVRPRPRARAPLDPAFLAAVIYQESKFRAGAKSSSGAIGLMQLTPSTAQGIAIRTHRQRVPHERSLRRRINIRYGAWYLDNLFKKYGSERLVLAAYNAGQGNVDRWRRTTSRSSSRRRAPTLSGSSG